MNIGDRIKELRKRKSLSQEELALRANFSKSYIQKFEEGKREIKSSQLVQLSVALDISVIDLLENTNYESSEFTLRNIEFREEHRINFDTDFFARKILSNLHKEYSNYCRLEKLMNEDVSFQNPLNNFGTISTCDQVEEAAKILRKKWKLENTPIYDLVGFLEDLGIKIFEVEEDESFAGFSCWEKRTPIIVLNIKNVDIPRRRFTVLHEISHLLLKFDDKLNKEEIERFCNYFAGAMLLPKDVLMKYVGNMESITLEELKRIKSKYGISIFAIIVRIMSIGLISWERYNEWKDLYNSWKEKDLCYQGIERVSRFNYLIAKGLRENIFTKDMASELSGINISEINEDLINRKLSF